MIGTTRCHGLLVVCETIQATQMKLPSAWPIKKRLSQGAVSVLQVGWVRSSVADGDVGYCFAQPRSSRCLVRWWDRHQEHSWRDWNRGELKRALSASLRGAACRGSLGEEQETFVSDETKV